MNPEDTRRYDIDWLRVIAIGMLIIYHIGIGFQPWAVFLAFIQNEDTLQSIWPFMALLNIWRIPLLFFVSGMGVCFAMRKRNWKQLVGERIRRILIPLVFGSLVIVPMHILIWQFFYNQDINYNPSMGHLWFLANIFLYVLILSPLFVLLKKNNRIGNLFVRIFSNPLGLILVLIVFIIEALVANPESYETYFNSLHGFILGFLAFFFGFIIVFSGTSFWILLNKLKWVFLSAAGILFLNRWLIFELKSPLVLYPIESISWILAAFGIAYRYLNKPGKILSYLSRAAYPVYILHMIFIYIGSYYLFPLDLSAIMKFFILILFTFMGSLLTYEFIIKRIGFFRPLFGLRIMIKNK